VAQEAGREWTVRNDLAPDFAQQPAGERRSLAYFWLVADPQIIDEESPIRFEAWDLLYRPQGHLIPQVFESQVRSAARLQALSRPFDFIALAGDLTDGSQRNELRWLLTGLNGGVIDPDSGIDDDPLPGPGNDYNDPFFSAGIDAPWYAVLGNHDSLYNGGFGNLEPDVLEAAVGDTLFQYLGFENGFRDGSTLNADVVDQGTTPPDADRQPLTHQELVTQLFQAGGQPQGHGFSAEGVAANRAYFSVQPIPGRPLRLLALDSVYQGEQALGIGAQGFMDQAQFDWLQENLQTATDNGELVIVLSHHRSVDFSDQSPVSGTVLTQLLANSPSVMLHLTGHAHFNDLQSFQPQSLSAANGYWEVLTASTVDFPMHTRIIELVDEGNGYLSIILTSLDHNAPEGSLAHRARELAAARLAFPNVGVEPDVAAFWEADSRAHNLILRLPLSGVVQQQLAQHSWPETIESETVLRQLTAPQ